MQQQQQGQQQQQQGARRSGGLPVDGTVGVGVGAAAVYRALPVPASALVDKTATATATAMTKPTTRVAEPAVYRSLAVVDSMMASTSLGNAPVGKAPAPRPQPQLQQKVDGFVAALANVVAHEHIVPGSASGGGKRMGAVTGLPPLPLPLELYPLAHTHVWMDAASPEELVRKVHARIEASVGDRGLVQLVRTNSKCRIDVAAHGDSFTDNVTLAVNFADAKSDPRAPKRYLVEAQRLSGSPFEFSNIVEQSLCGGGAGGSPVAKPAVAPGATTTTTKRRFAPPPLPVDMVQAAAASESCAACKCRTSPGGCDATGVCARCLDHDAQILVDLASSGIFEHRANAVCLLADRVAQTPSFAKRLVALGAKPRIAPLATDANVQVRRAAERVLVAMASA